MSKAEKIKAEIERLKNELIQEAEKGYKSEFDEGRISAFEDMITFIDSLEEEPVSNDLEEAAKKVGQKYFPNEDNIWARPNYEAKKAEYAFMEGAQWQKDKACEWCKVIQTRHT